MRVPKVIASVASLDRLCCPAAVGWLSTLLAFIAFPACVTPVSVDSVERVQEARGFADVFDECFGGFTPSLADVVSASAVKSEVIVFGVVAPPYHLRPNPEFANLRKPVCSVASPASASATLSIFDELREFIRPFDSGLTTDAPTFPEVFAALPAVEANDCDRSKYGAGKVFEGGLSRLRLLSSHDKFLSSEGRLWLEPAGVTAPVRLDAFYTMTGLSYTV